MTTERVAEHRCHYAVLVLEHETGWWRFATAVPGHPGTYLDISHCPGCGRRLNRKGVRLLERDVRSEEGRR